MTTAIVDTSTANIASVRYAHERLGAVVVVEVVMPQVLEP